MKNKNIIIAPPEVSESDNNSIKIELFNIEDKQKLKDYLWDEYSEMKDRDRYLINTIIDMDLSKSDTGRSGRMLCFGPDVMVRNRNRSRVISTPCIFLAKYNVGQVECFLGQEEQQSVDLHCLRIPFDKIDFIMGIDYRFSSPKKYVIKEKKEKKSNGKKK